MTETMKRREFITLLGGAVTWPIAVRAQQSARNRKVGFLHPGQSAAVSKWIAAIHDGLNGADSQETATRASSWLSGLPTATCRVCRRWRRTWRRTAGGRSARDVGGVVDENHGSQTAVVVLRDIADETGCVIVHGESPVASPFDATRYDGIATLARLVEICR